ncbi:Lar family restriction alleviation protein [Megasphaera hexanoica]|uniref:Lar family restriction alleviation protein n=1 Tax=Megasphaera hexanoica TaxID=1675036 RepID=A0ABW7DQW7_9FIRM|nr:Lar family restriction alleviation protein [Megasphaera hexanoica]MBS5582806.1 Lar family restriction alleviation protein [Megasphaera sp.]DAH64585.1 MAG TPA: restriction alleviation protein [Caudoviricetes sp.]
MTESRSKVLKRCPFCGTRKPVMLWSGGSQVYYVFCTNCRAKGGWSKSREEAAELWNARVWK